MTRGVIDTIKLMATVALAIPVAYMGIDFLVFKGQPLLGGAFIVLAALMLAVEHYITSPTDIPASAAQKAAGTIAKAPEDEEEGSR